MRYLIFIVLLINTAYAEPECTCKEGINCRLDPTWNTETYGNLVGGLCNQFLALFIEKQFIEADNDKLKKEVLKLRRKLGRRDRS